MNSPGNVAIGSLEGTIHNILSEVLNIDTCPGGTFECPPDGAPLFGIPTCDPRFCISDVQDNNNLAPDQQDDCAREALLSAGVAFLSEFIPTGGIIDPRSGPVAAAVAALSEWKEIITNPVIAGRVAKVLTPIVGEVAGETFIPVLGEAILTAQVLHGLYEATGAYTEGLDTCTAKYSGK